MHHDDAQTSEGDDAACSKCRDLGFINLGQVPDDPLLEFLRTRDPELIRRWIEAAHVHNVRECGCR